MPSFLIATNNPHKVSEISKIIVPSLCPGGEGILISELASGFEDSIGVKELLAFAENVTFLPAPKLSEEPVEDGDTLEENAFIKAKFFAGKTGKSSISDDTGLFVDALDGAPGIFAARYAGEGCSFSDNMNLLLKNLEGIPLEKRTASFFCSACLFIPETEEAIWTQGILRGKIATDIRGTGGFGYDPIFILPDGKSLAELTPFEKKTPSAQGAGIQKSLIGFLKDLSVQSLLLICECLYMVFGALFFHFF
jgi:XTP/dITP diphosphohydrolase